MLKLVVRPLILADSHIKRNLLFALSNTDNDFSICLFVSLAVTEILILAWFRETVGYLIGCEKIPFLKR